MTWKKIGMNIVRHVLMPKSKCKEIDCNKWVKMPPNRPTATGYCRKCWQREIKKQWLKI